MNLASIVSRISTGAVSTAPRSCPTTGTIVAYSRGAYGLLARDPARLPRAHSRDATRIEDSMLEDRLAARPGQAH